MRVVLDNSEQFERKNEPAGLRKIRLLRIQNLLPKNIKKVIDVGTGTGELAVMLAQNGLDVTTVDKHPDRFVALADIARELSIKMQTNDVFAIEENDYDLVTSQGMLETLPDYVAGLEKLGKLIKFKAWGLFCVPYNINLLADTTTDPGTGKLVHKYGYKHSINRENITIALSKAGLKAEKIILTNCKHFNHLEPHRFACFLDMLFTRILPHTAQYMIVLCKKQYISR